jgi:hypothetical protein
MLAVLPIIYSGLNVFPLGGPWLVYMPERVLANVDL